LHHRLAYTAIFSVILLAVGLFALQFPVFLDAYDQWGWQIKCGTGYATDLTQAAEAVGDQNFVDECETELLTRRLWTIPLVVIGGLALLAVMVVAATTSARESLVPHRDTA
jgi:H+/Cl- antiporter ClcA